MAVKAKPGVIEYREKDGTTIRVLLHGDEHAHFMSTTDNYLLVENEEGIYEYAVKDAKGFLVASGIRASAPATAVKRSLITVDEYKASTAMRVGKTRSSYSVRSVEKASGQPKYRYSSSAFPTTGTPHSLVILVEYPDHGFNVENPREYFNDFLNGDNFTQDKASGSVRQYYSENSCGSFVPTYDVYGPIMMKNYRRYYGGGQELNANQMVIESVEALDDTVDFSVYDHNDDGYVDSVYIIYADKGQADGGPGETVWPYSWELEEEGVDLYADGVKFNTYGCSNELQNDGDMEGIGTFTHEFGHVLGLPDLYNTFSGSDQSTPCNWSVMDNGSYNNDCRTPCHLSSFERYSLGWLDPVVIYNSGHFEIPELSSSNHACLFGTNDNPDEFYMLEYRKKEGWDRYLKGEGMLVWHIDFDQTSWDENTVNNDRTHQRIALVRADNAYGASSYSSDPFPGTLGVTEFSRQTTPGITSWNDSKINVTRIYNIAETGECVEFDVETLEDLTPASVDRFETESDIQISGNTVSSSRGSVKIYDISGRMVGETAPGRPVTVENGLYIIGGKKVLIK